MSEPNYPGFDPQPDAGHPRCELLAGPTIRQYTVIRVSITSPNRQAEIQVAVDSDLDPAQQQALVTKTALEYFAHATSEMPKDDKPIVAGTTYAGQVLHPIS